jgi:hypothetical protein
MSAVRKLMLALVLVSGCGEKAAPVLAAQEFANVMQRGDAKALIPLIELEAAARLERAATRASDQVGGRRNIELYEMVQVVDVPDSFRVAKSEMVEGDDTQAQVALIGADGTRYLLDMVYQEGSWRVRVPMPPGEEAP